MTTPTVTTPVAAPALPPIIQTPAAAVKKPSSKMFDIKPINFVTIGSAVETLVDIYPSSNVDPNAKDEDDGSKPAGFIDSGFISVEKTVAIIGQAQFQSGNDVYIRVEVLGEDCSGWVTVYSSSVFKEWQWMIPPKRAKIIKDAFNAMFKVVVPG